MAKKDYEEKYTHPEMREEIKEEVKQSDKGGAPGQWSARKSQLLTQEYEKRGGGYKGEQDEDQKNLEQWTEEEWQTQDGGAEARGAETARYLPKKAWENMSEDERRETEQKKREGSRQGQQYVDNTEEAQQARREAQQNFPLNGYDSLNVEEVTSRIQGLSKEEIGKVLAYEKQNENRKTLVESLESQAED